MTGVALRIRIMAGVLLGLFSLLGTRLFYMQVVRGEHYRRQAHERIQHERILDPKRGQIYDRHGTPLVHNEATFDVLVVPSKLEPGVLARLATLLDRPLAELEAGLQEVEAEVARWIESDLERRFASASRSRQRRARRSLGVYFRRRAYQLVEDLTAQEHVAAIFVDPKRYAGLVVRPRPIRRYPLGTSAGHLVGYMGRVQAEEFGRLRGEGYEANDRLGRTGLERRFERELRGRRGIEVRGRRNPDGSPGKVLFHEPPINGRALQLTLDLTLQTAAEEALDKRLAELGELATRRAQAGETTFPAPPGGAVVLMDVETGGLLALATAPRYDPSRLSADYATLVEDPRAPLSDRSRGGRRVPPPGSVFKILTAIAGLEDRRIHPGKTVVCHGYLHEPGRFRCWKTRGHGTVDLYDAVQGSCNIYFYRLGEAVGGERMGHWGRMFGFGQKTGIALKEQAGTMPDPAWKWQRLGRRWFKADSRFTGIGQGMLETTPLQVARFMAAVATRGLLPRARLLADAPVRREQIQMSPSTWNIVHRAMRRVVTRGTASSYDLDRFELAAKTGTAEVHPKVETHAWLAGFAPASAPRVAIVVLVENAGHGGEIAGPIANAVLSAWAKREEGVR